MNPRCPLAHSQMQDLAAEWESGESQRYVRGRDSGWTKELPQYHEEWCFRFGGDKRSARPLPTNSVNPIAIMRTHAEEIKGDLFPLNPVQVEIYKLLGNRESVKHHSEKGKTREVRERREMASSSKGKLSTEEQLKEMDKALENLKQLLQNQLDFLRNLDTEARRRLE